MATDSASLPATGSHGGDASMIADALGLDPRSMIDLSASMNPFAPNVAALLAPTLDHAVTRYPNATAATGQLAAAIGIDPDLLVLTNGGAEAIALVAQATVDGHVVAPEFSLYERHLATLDPNAPRWRSNPSNPLGVLAATSETAGVWDEAFYPIATGTWTRGDENSWRLGSLTKLWNCPGLRLGYAIAPTLEAASDLRNRQPRWAVNGLALAVVGDLVATTDLAEWSGAIAALRDEFSDALRALGFAVRNTDVNWVLVERPDLRAALAPHGIVVRDCASFGLPGVHRVALPSRAQFERVVAAFAAVEP
jgi:histidinol-phosphate/aromatic aminotransferase/cobyric acid decarboxylase-like protein